MGKRKRGTGSQQPLAKRTKVDASAAATAAHTAASDAAEQEALFQDRSLFTADLSRADHSRELALYRHLSSADVETRIRAADVIVSALLGDKTAAAGEQTGVSEAVLLRHLERRLLRGLASGSEAARVGFSYVLSELLGQLFGAGSGSSGYPGLTFDRVLDLLLEKTKPGSNLPGQEERDHFWGQLFGLQSFAESGVLFAAEEDGSNRWDRVLRCLLQLGRRKVWLRPQAAFVVVQALARGHVPDAAAAAATLRTIAADEAASGMATAPEGLGIWLAARARFPDLALPPPWTAPLSAAGAYKDLVAVLRASSSSDEAASASASAPSAKGPKQGNASAQLHFVWDLLLAEVLRQRKQLDAFWVAVVDQVYFAKGASDHQKLTGFKIFQKALALSAAAGSVPPSLFSQNLMACVMNQASNATPRLHRAAVQVLKAVEKLVEDRPAVLPQVLAALLGTAAQAHGVYDFDERVKGTGDGTKPVEKILRFATPDNVQDVIQLLRTGALEAPDSKTDQKPLRIFADYLFRLATRAGSAAETEADGPSVGSVAFAALAEVAYPDKEADGALPALNEKTQAACRTYLLSAAGALLKRPDDFASFCRTVLAIDPAAAVGAGAGAAMPDEVATQVCDARKLLKHLLRDSDKAEGAISRACQGLAVLLAVSLLQLYHEPRPDALEVLQDIKACSDKLASLEKKKDKKSKKSKKKDQEDQENAPEPDIGEVLTEVLLAMLAESSQLTRQASVQVFEAFTPYMSAKALDNLADVLAAEENTTGYRTLFNIEEEEEDSDIEMDAEEDEEEEEDDDDEEEDDDEDEDDEEDGEEDGKDKVNGLEAALMKTFRVPHTLGKEANGKADAEDGADDSDSESDMSDDAMLALDGQLAGHLRLLKDKTDGHRKQRDEARGKVAAFKHRVLDLLEAYVRREAAAATSPGGQDLVLRLLLPLAVLVRDTKEGALAQKASRIVQEAQRQLKRGRVEKTAGDTEAALAILSALHEAANDRAESRAFAAAVSAASLTVASAVFAWDRSAYTRVADVYRRTQDRWVLDGWSVRASLFTDWHNWCQNARQQLTKE